MGEKEENTMQARTAWSREVILKPIIRVFPRRTSLTPDDELSFVGDPPLFKPAKGEVHISCAFTWDKPEAERLLKAWSQYYPAKIGGPAYGSPCETFMSGRYVKKGVTFTSRGCNNQCPWCLVPEREGKLRELPVIAGNIINDNNILQCSASHISKVFQMLRTQRHIEFTGGLDCRETTSNLVEELRSLKIYHLFFACDTKAGLKELRRVGKLFSGADRRMLRCYVLLAFGSQTISQAIAHLEAVWEAGFMPHAQLFQPPDKWIEYSREWRQLSTRWIRPAIMQTMNGKDSAVEVRKEKR
jgi:hypothetical protein